MGEGALHAPTAETTKDYSQRGKFLFPLSDKSAFFVFPMWFCVVEHQSQGTLLQSPPEPTSNNFGGKLDLNRYKLTVHVTTKVGTTSPRNAKTEA
eukprot:4970437-Amphidinium_carterae.1